MKSICNRKKLKLLVFGISFVFLPTNFIFASTNAKGSANARISKAVPAACPLSSGTLAQSPNNGQLALSLFNGSPPGSPILPGLATKTTR